MPDLRFVILRHEGVESPHFDLMFETSSGSDLATFRCPKWPVTLGTELTALSDHRRAYLDYEGPLSNNRGHVTRVLSGSCNVEGSISMPPRQVIRLLTPAPIAIVIEQAAERWRVVQVSA